MKSIIVRLDCITNMHVGNGDVNYNIIDNEVERDPVTNYPTINASGVKGALREYFSKDNNLKAYVNKLFGEDGNNGNGTKSGTLKILQADMLAIPARASEGNSAYYLVTTKEALNKLKEKKNIFLHNTQGQGFNTQLVTGIAVEGVSLEEKVTINDKDIYVISDKEFREKISLPVIARNNLENGISKNLWYEEVVPHESIFTFAVITDDNNENDLEDFKNSINSKVIKNAEEEGDEIGDFVADEETNVEDIIRHIDSTFMISAIRMVLDDNSYCPKYLFFR